MAMLRARPAPPAVNARLRPPFMLVFRDVRQPRRTSLLLRQLQQTLGLQDAPSALLLAGELECGLADALEEENPARRAGEALTTALAERLLDQRSELPNLAALERCDLPPAIQVSVPEGF